MLDERALFSRPCPNVDGVFFCLDATSQEDRIKKVEIETYSERAKAFDATKMLNLTQEHQEIMEPLARLPRGSAVLEVGGGDGRFAFHLMKRGCTVIESDIAPGSVRKTKAIADANGITNGMYAVIDAEDLPFKDASLDGVFMVASLHHIPRPEKAIAEFHRCLKPGGTLLILREPASWQYVVFGPAFWLIRKFLRRKGDHGISLADDETWGFTVKRLKQMLSGFHTVELAPTSYVYKCYYNALLLARKLSKKDLKESAAVKRALKKVDAVIERIPVLNGFTWDWDIECRK